MRNTDVHQALQNRGGSRAGAGQRRLAVYPGTGYQVSSTILLNGSNYVVSGCGQGCMGAMSMIEGANGFNGPAFNLQNAQNVTLRRLAFELHVEQTSSGGGTSSVMYDGLYFYRGDELQLESLPANSTAEIIFISTGALDFDNVRRRRFSAHFNEAITTVEGTAAKTGLLGFITFIGIPQSAPMITVEDNQDMIVDDCYFEQATTEAVKLHREFRRSRPDGSPWASRARMRS